MSDGDPINPDSTQDKGNSTINAVGGSQDINPLPRSGDVVVNQADQAAPKKRQTEEPTQPSQKDILDRIKAGERWMIFFTAIVALTTVAQVIQSACNNASTSKQVDRIIEAANTQACAARQIAAASKRNAVAAERFSASAERINKQSKAAVVALTDLVSKTQDANDRAERALSIQTRPWIGIEIKDVKFTALRKEPNKIPMFDVGVTFSLRNYGSSPALRVYPSFEFASDTPGPNRMPHQISNACVEATSRSKMPNEIAESIFPAQQTPPKYNQLNGTIGKDRIHGRTVWGCVAYKGVTDETMRTTVVRFRFAIAIKGDDLEGTNVQVTYVEAE